MCFHLPTAAVVKGSVIQAQLMEGNEAKSPVPSNSFTFPFLNFAALPDPPYALPQRGSYFHPLNEIVTASYETATV